MATRLLDGPGTHYVVLSTDELRSFPGTWHADARRVHVSPFYWTLPDHSPEIVAGSGVFAGGNSQRDYPTLLAAIRRLTSAMVTVAANCPPESEPFPAMSTCAPCPRNGSGSCSGAAPPSSRQWWAGRSGARGSRRSLECDVASQDHRHVGRPWSTRPRGGRGERHRRPTRRPAAPARCHHLGTRPTQRRRRETMRARAVESARRFSADAYVGRLLDVVDAP